jgi:hypothetical protein
MYKACNQMNLLTVQNDNHRLEALCAAELLRDDLDIDNLYLPGHLPHFPSCFLGQPRNSMFMIKNLTACGYRFLFT